MLDLLGDSGLVDMGKVDDAYGAILREEVGCIVCRLEGHGYVYPALHHPTTMRDGTKAPEMLRIPLCDHHHQNGGHGEAIHAGYQTFMQNHGGEPYLLAETLYYVMRIIKN